MLSLTLSRTSNMSPMTQRISSCTLMMQISLSLLPQSTRGCHGPRHRHLLRRLLPPSHLRRLLQLLPQNRLPRHLRLPSQSRRPQLRPHRRSLNRRKQWPLRLHLAQALTQTPKNLLQVVQVSAPLSPTRRITPINPAKALHKWQRTLGESADMR